MLDLFSAAAAERQSQLGLKPAAGRLLAPALGATRARGERARRRRRRESQDGRARLAGQRDRVREMKAAAMDR